jgi:hypothetical protein
LLATVVIATIFIVVSMIKSDARSRRIKAEIDRDFIKVVKALVAESSLSGGEAIQTYDRLRRFEPMQTWMFLFIARVMIEKLAARATAAGETGPENGSFQTPAGGG